MNATNATNLLKKEQIQIEIFKDIQRIEEKASALWKILEDCAEEDNLFKTLVMSKIVEKTAKRIRELLNDQIKELQETVKYSIDEGMRNLTENQKKYILREWAKL
jgi:nitrogen regulatory protein PII-like uncharacterized protein